MRQAHDRLSLPLKFICTDVNNDSKTNEADMKIPFLGMEWCRQTDTIRFNGSFSIKKKNRLGQNELEDTSSITKNYSKIYTG